MNPPKIIAEIGGNHRGSVETAKEMIGIAASFCKVDVVKFQKRCNKELLSPEQYSGPHPNPANSYGDTYGAHREFIEFDVDQHRELQECCEKFGVSYSSSVWDITSAREIASLNPKLIKIGSPTNTHWDLHKFLCENYEGEIHVSFGMTTHEEMDRIVQLYEDHKRGKDLVLYSCTSGYPVVFEDMCLLELNNLQEKYGSRVKEIGFSGHHLGIAVDVAAQTLGASWIERHFTLDRTWKGTDHAASLEPDGMRKLVRNSKAIAKSLAHRPTEILAVEVPMRAKLKWGCYNVEEL
jgi:N-acetylneuraminate synthase